MFRKLVWLQMMPVRGVAGSLAGTLNKHRAVVMSSSYFSLLPCALYLKDGAFCRSNGIHMEVSKMQSFFFYAWGICKLLFTYEWGLITVVIKGVTKCDDKEFGDLNQYCSVAHREVVEIPSILCFVDIFIANLRCQGARLRYTVMNQIHTVHIFIILSQNGPVRGYTKYYYRMGPLLPGSACTRFTLPTTREI